MATVRARIIAAANGIGRIAQTGDLVYVKMIERGIDADLRTAAAELDDFRAQWGREDEPVPVGDPSGRTVIGLREARGTVRRDDTDLVAKACALSVDPVRANE